MMNPNGSSCNQNDGSALYITHSWIGFVALSSVKMLWLDVTTIRPTAPSKIYRNLNEAR